MATVNVKKDAETVEIPTRGATRVTVYVADESTPCVKDFVNAGEPCVEVPTKDGTKTYLASDLSEDMLNAARLMIDKGHCCNLECSCPGNSPSDLLSALVSDAKEKASQAASAAANASKSEKDQLEQKAKVTAAMVDQMQAAAKRF